MHQERLMYHISKYLIYKGSAGEPAVLNEEDQKKVNLATYHLTPDLDPKATAYRNDHIEIEYHKWTQTEEVDAAIQLRAIRMKWGCKENDV
jgi:hypothetical protein